VSSVESWLTTSISPRFAIGFHLLDPLGQRYSAHQPTAAKLDVGDLGTPATRPLRRLQKCALLHRRTCAPSRVVSTSGSLSRSVCVFMTEEYVGGNFRSYWRSNHNPQLARKEK